MVILLDCLMLSVLSTAMMLRSYDEFRMIRSFITVARSERGQVDAGFMTDAVRKRYDANYRATDSAIQLQADIAAINRPQPGTNRGNIP
jgi:hypothetical protein